MEDDPRYREEPQTEDKAEVARDRLVVPADLQAETKALTGQVQKAQKIVRDQIAVSVSPSGKLRRNGPCLCGSGRKFKACCMQKIKTGYIPPVSLSGRPQPVTVPVPPTRKLRKAAELCHCSDQDQQTDAGQTTTIATKPEAGSNES